MDSAGTLRRKLTTLGFAPTTVYLAPQGAAKKILPALVSLWIDKFDAVTNLWSRKLWVLALITLLGCDDDDVLVFIPQILECVVDLLHELDTERAVAYATRQAPH